MEKEWKDKSGTKSPVEKRSVLKLPDPREMQSMCDPKETVGKEKVMKTESYKVSSWVFFSKTKTR